MTSQASPGRPGAVGFRTVGWGAVAVLVLASIAGTVGYLKMIRYERRAIHHIPASAAWAVQVDVQSVIVYNPVRTHLIPLLQEGIQAQRLRRLREQGGLNFARDLREVVVAGNDSHWVVILGGLFGDRSLVELVEQHVLVAEHWVGWKKQGDLLVQRDAPGTTTHLAMGQSPDGLWMLADSPQFLEQALTQSARFEELGLVLGAEASWGILPALSQRKQGFWALPGVKGTERLSGRLSAGTTFALEVALRPEPDTDVSVQLKQWQPPGGSVWEAWLPTVEWGGERRVLLRLKASQQGEIVQLRSSWTRLEADRAAKSLAAWVQRLSQPSISPQ